MNKYLLQDAIGMVGDDLIVSAGRHTTVTAVPRKRMPTKWRVAVLVAACLALVVCLMAAVPGMLNGFLPSENTNPTSTIVPPTDDNDMAFQPSVNPPDYGIKVIYPSHVKIGETFEIEILAKAVRKINDEPADVNLDVFACRSYEEDEIIKDCLYQGKKKFDELKVSSVNSDLTNDSFPSSTKLTLNTLQLESHYLAPSTEGYNGYHEEVYYGCGQLEIRLHADNTNNITHIINYYYNKETGYLAFETQNNNWDPRAFSYDCTDKVPTFESYVSKYLQYLNYLDNYFQNEADISYSSEIITIGSSS